MKRYEITCNDCNEDLGSTDDPREAYDIGGCDGAGIGQPLGVQPSQQRSVIELDAPTTE